jgi:hypothetical protein
MDPVMGTLVLFFDGIGIGTGDPLVNPFAATEARHFAPLAGREPRAGTSFRPLDATLGVPGLPQSATGQTTILTGINAAKVAGRHVQGIPGPMLAGIIERESLFLKLVRSNRRPTFANAYTREHLEAPRPRWSATTRAVMAARLPFRMLDDHERRDEALPHDYTGEWWRRHGLTVAKRTARDAAAVLVGLTEGHDVVLYEYFLTDLMGHRGTWEDRLREARRAEDLVSAVLERVDLARHRVVTISDHGNLEDGQHGRHTLNPVALLAWGRGAEALVERVHGLDGLTPALVDGV